MLQLLAEITTEMHVWHVVRLHQHHNNHQFNNLQLAIVKDKLD
jgi:hypothetical protein